MRRSFRQAMVLTFTFSVLLLGLTGCGHQGHTQAAYAKIENDTSLTQDQKNHLEDKMAQQDADAQYEVNYPALMWFLAFGSGVFAGVSGIWKRARESAGISGKAKGKGVKAAASIVAPPTALA